MEVVRRLVLDPGPGARLGVLAGEAWPEECCGVLLGRRSGPEARVHDLRPGRNRALDPRRGFELDPRDLLAVLRDRERDDREVIGFYHSHPATDTTPSRRDLAEAWTSFLQLIVSPHESARWSAWVNDSTGARVVPVLRP